MSDIMKKYPHITSPRLRNSDEWFSRFYATEKSAYETLSATKFREPAPDQQGRIAVPFEHSWEFTHKGLWDSLENMLCRHDLQKDNDNIVAFTVVDVIEPELLLCHGKNVLLTDERKTIDLGHCQTDLI